MAKHLKIEDLSKSNVWGLTESEVNQMLLDGKKDENWGDNEARYMNIIRPVFDLKYFDRGQTELMKKMETEGYDIFSIPTEGSYNAVAIRKRRVKRITDLTLENIHHLSAEEVLALVDANMGTGWQGLSLAIQDIIESAFYVDSSVLPEYAMHRKGGLISRRKADGYDVLEIKRGDWIEAIFLKAKPKIEKAHYSSAFNEPADNEDDDDDEDLPDDDVDDMATDEEDEEDVEIVEDEENPELEDIDAIDESTLDEDDN